MKNCPHCGTEINNNTSTCPKCGAKTVEVINIGPDDIFYEEDFSDGHKRSNTNTDDYFDTSYRVIDEDGKQVNKPYVHPRIQGIFFAGLTVMLSIFGGIGLIPAIYGLTKEDYKNYKPYFAISFLISIMWIIIYIFLILSIR